MEERAWAPLIAVSRLGGRGWRGFLLSGGVAGGVVLGLADVRPKSATKKPPVGGYLVQWSQRPGSNR